MKLVIEGPGGRKVIDYSLMTLAQIEKRLKGYERRFESYEKFMSHYDCGSSTPKEAFICMDWASLLEEREKLLQRQTSTGGPNNMRRPLCFP